MPTFPFFSCRKLWLVKTKMCDGGARAFTYLFIAPIKIAVMFVGMIVYVEVSNIFPLRKDGIQIFLRTVIVSI